MNKDLKIMFKVLAVLLLIWVAFSFAKITLVLIILFAIYVLAANRNIYNLLLSTIKEIIRWK